MINYHEVDPPFEFSNEFQAAYYNSNALFDGDRIEKIPDGMFAVVAVSLAYCPITDAVLHRHNRSIVKLWGTERLAQWHASKLTSTLNPEDCGGWYEVLPRPAAPRLPAPSDDDIPF